MIPDIGWVELLVIAAATIIVVGPKDLPRLMRILGQWMGKARGLAREFQRSFDDLIRESELDDLRKEVEELKSLNPIDDIKKSLDVSDELRDLDASLKTEMTGVDQALKQSGQDTGEQPAEDPGEDPDENVDEFGADLLAAQNEIEAGKDAERQVEAEAGSEVPGDVGAVKP